MREGSYQSAHMHPPSSTTARDHTVPKQAQNTKATRTTEKNKHKPWAQPKDRLKESKDMHDWRRRSTATHSFGSHNEPSASTPIDQNSHWSPRSWLFKPRRCPLQRFIPYLRRQMHGRCHHIDPRDFIDGRTARGFHPSESRPAQ